MKNTKKRGFTIVELVIVIAVIAILAAVLIPTFSNVITKANESAAMQEARAVWYDYIASLDSEKVSSLSDYDGVLEYEGCFFTITDGSFTAEAATEATKTAGQYNFKYDSTNKKITANKVS